LLTPERLACRVDESQALESRIKRAWQKNLEMVDEGVESEQAPA
jgi:hypothetical protein